MTLLSIQQRFLTVGGSAAGAPAASRWAAILTQVIKHLETLNSSTERDFLAVGEKLMQFRLTARQIQSDMAAVVELISGDQARNASHALTGMLEHSQAMEARIERSERELASVRDLSTGLRRAFSGLPNMVSMFRTLCTLTRIETSRLGSSGADLGHLAAEIRPLSESIQTSGEGVLEASLRLDEKTQSALRSGAELRATQLKQMPALIASGTASLRLLEERRQLAIQSSERQAAEYVAACEAFDDLVGSIQFHDITRQQVEHVIETLREVRTTWTGAGAGARSLAPAAQAILPLQCSQLAEAALSFVASVERIDGDLESIGTRVGKASEAVQALMGFSASDPRANDAPGQVQDSFFVKMEGDFSAILEKLATCTAAQADMDSTTASLADTIARMRESVDEIRGTEIRIQRISTNATIGATHIGAPGVALNKIAEAMQRMALESNANTEGVAATLDGMSLAAGRVAVSAVAGLGAQTRSNETMSSQVADEMRATVRELHSSKELSQSRVNEIATLGARLAAEIGALRGSLSVRSMFAAAVERARQELEGIAEQARQLSPQDTGADHKRHLERFAQSYTMQRQREIHDSVVQGTALPLASAAPVPSQVTSGDGDLGDNVELF
jgi:hypothetical protein